jgi:hypothetical protein
MTRIVKRDEVDNKRVNLAYVGGRNPKPSDVEVIPVSGGGEFLERKIMYGDIAGRLVDEQGVATLHDPFPAVTDLFFDKDKNRLLDAAEATAETALPYSFTTTRPYFGQATIPAKDTYTHDEDKDTFVGERPGRYATDAEDIKVVYADDRPYDGSYHVMVERMEVGVVGEPVDKDPDTGPESVDEDEHEGMTAYRVWVHLDRDDVELYVRYNAAEVVDSAGVWRPSHIEPDRRERINARPLFTYTDMATATDPRNDGRRLVASKRVNKGYELYSPNAALVDTRQPDFFFWRLKANFTRATPTYAIEKDTVRIGVIGPVPANLSRWLSGTTQDKATKSKVTFVNPHPGSVYWRASVNFGAGYDAVMKRLSDYDVIIYISDNVRWDTHGKYFNAFVERGGTVLVDVLGNTQPKVTDSHEGALGFSFGPVKKGINLAFDENNPVAVAMKKQAIGYDISDTEIDKMTYKMVDDKGWFFPALRALPFKTAKSGEIHFSLPAGTEPVQALKKDSNSYLSSFTNISGNSWKLTGATSKKQYRIYYASHEGRIVRGTNAAKTPAMMAYGPFSGGGKLIVSGMGLCHIVRKEAKQLLANILMSTGRVDEGVSSGSVTTQFSLCLPWKRDWVMGTDDKDKPVLTVDEMKENNFFTTYDAANKRTLVRKGLSDKTAQEMVKQHIASDPQFKSITLLPSDIITYELEIAGSSGLVKGEGPVNAADVPSVYTTRKTERFQLPDGFRLGRFSKDEQASGPRTVDADRPYSAAVMARYEGPVNYEITFDLTVDAIHKETTTKRVEGELDTGSGVVKAITTRSDMEWHAIHGGSPVSNKNLASWGQVSNKKWYPWDGQAMLLLNSNASGDHVRYIQNALNHLHAIGADSYSGAKNPYLPLKVTGHYDARTQEAVRWYQTGWRMTANADVDAGTAGHILRNARNRTNDPEMDERWRKFGPLTNMIDGKSDTCHGRRSWINMDERVKMQDAVFIQLTKPVEVLEVMIRPVLSGAHADTLHITKLGSALGGKVSFDIKDGRGFIAKDREKKEHTMKRRLVDRLFIHFEQDKAFHGNSKMWAISDLLFNAYIPSSSTKRHTTSIEHPMSGKQIAISGCGVWVHEWTPDEVKKYGAAFIGYADTEAELAAKIKASIEEHAPGMSDYFNIKVSYSGKKIRLEITVIEATLPVSTISHVSVANGVATLTCTNAYAIGPANVKSDDVSIDGLEDEVSDLNGFNQPLTPTSATSATMAAGTVPDGEYDCNGSIRMVVVSPAWSGSLKETETGRVNQVASDVETLIGHIDNVGENWRIMISAIMLSGSSAVEAVLYDVNTQKFYTKMTLNEYRQRAGSVRLAVIAKTVEVEDPDTVRATVYPKLYAMRPYGVVTRGVAGMFAAVGLSGDALDEVWGLEVATGEYDKDVKVPDKMTYVGSSPYKKHIINQAGNTVVAHYEVMGGPYSASKGAPYTTITNEDAEFVDSSTIKVSRHPIAYDETGAAMLSVTVNGTKASIDQINAATGMVTLDDAIDELDDIKATYTIIERSIVYRGIKDANGTMFFDVCPLKGHSISTARDVHVDVTAMLGKAAYVYVIPKYLDINGSLVSTTATTGLTHTFDVRIFDPTSPYYDPFALLVAKVEMKPIDLSETLVVDARRGGGGIPDEEVGHLVDKDTRTHGFYDIGSMDGDAYLPAGTVVVKLPVAWRDAWREAGTDPDRLATSVIAELLPAGKTGIIQWSNGDTVPVVPGTEN